MNVLDGGDIDCELYVLIIVFFLYDFFFRKLAAKRYLVPVYSYNVSFTKHLHCITDARYNENDQ